MPRIDPHQLLSCLGVLLTPAGGILSKNEVQRLANLMTKFSKKLVSKCIYILILKSTDSPLLGAFMTEGGWNLVHLWLQDGLNNKNWALVLELLELLLMSPTDVEQLKMNNLPKLVKSLSKQDDQQDVKEFASQLVQKWLKIVKDDQVGKVNQANAEKMQLQAAPATVTVSESVEVVNVPLVKVDEIKEANSKAETQSDEENNVPLDDKTQSCYKLAVRDGKHILCKVPVNEANVTVVENAIIEDITPQPSKETIDENIPRKDTVVKQGHDVDPEESKEKKEADKKREKSNHDRNKSSNSKSRSSSSSRSRSRDKSKDKHRDKEKSSSSSSSKESRSKDRSKDKSRHDKDKHRNNGSTKSSSSKSSTKDKDKKETKEIQAEKDKDTLAKIQPQTLQKLGRIPKKSSDEKKGDKKEETKKSTFSIEVRKNNEEKPKTVKVFNAKMRSTGLLEEAKPPPPRPVKKVPSVLPSIPTKRSSPIRDTVSPPEKKPKVELAERPGAIKLIPPKPKPPVLQESDIFMDALAASASKKEVKKRKRRPSVSKDAQGSPPSSPSVTTASSPTNSPMAFKNIAPAKFYQDTLETENEESKEKTEDQEMTSEQINENPPTPTGNEESIDIDEPQTDSNGLKGVLVHTKRKGPKKSIRWKPDADLVEIQYFELDETERVNVTKTFMDMAKMELSGEREALQMSRKLQNDDIMDARTSWRMLIELDLKPPLAQPGCKSLEKDIQFAREKTTVSFPPFIQGRYSDSPAEPDHEVHQMTDPISIPLDDPENVEQDLPTQPWPEPKGSPPPVNIPNVPPIFPTIQTPFQNFNMGGPPPPFQNVPYGAPNFIPPNMMGGNNNSGNNEWNPINNMNNPPMMPPNNLPPHPDVIMNQQGPPNMFGPNHENFNQNMNDNFPPFNQQNMGMFPQNNFNMRGGRGGFRRGGGNGPWVRMNGPGHGGWNQRGMNRGGRICKNVKNHGYCRNRDNCMYIHPN